MKTHFRIKSLPPDNDLMRKNSVNVVLPVETAFEPKQVLGIRVELMAAFSCLIFAILCTCKISRILASEEDEYISIEMSVIAEKPQVVIMRNFIVGL